jgi:hypothetical protein
MFKNLILKSIKLYQKFISPNFGEVCRFYPSCSKFSSLAIEKYGLSRGLWRGIKRILKCHPWHRGGIDLP